MLRPAPRRDQNKTTGLGHRLSFQYGRVNAIEDVSEIAPGRRR